MRRLFVPCLWLGLGAGLAGCVGFDDFIDNTLTTRSNPNRPMGDSTNMRRVMGISEASAPVAPEPGNVWPRRVEPLPSLQAPEGGAPPLRPSDAPRPQRVGAAAAPSVPAALGQAAPRQAAAEDRIEWPAGPTTRPAGRTTPDPTSGAPATPRYQTVSTPSGTNVVVPNGDGSSTVMRPDGSMEQVPASR
jgi:hypothetical protein